jgi:phosphate transport system permease protein
MNMKNPNRHNPPARLQNANSIGSRHPGDRRNRIPGNAIGSGAGFGNSGIANIADNLLMHASRLALFAVLASLLLIIGVVLVRGLPALSLEILTQTPKGGFYLGGGGGILNAIVGSLYLSIGAVALAFIAALPIAIVLQDEYSKGAGWAQFVRFCLDLLWGIPSIVYGAFGFLIIVWLGWGVSLGAGILTLALVILPVMVRTMDEVLSAIPRSLFEPSLALGATRLETMAMIVYRQALPGIAVGCILGLGRALGDAASVLFTTGYTDYIPSSLSEPAASLPLAVFFQLGSPVKEVQERAYAAAFILLVIVMALTFAARWLSRKFEKSIIR